MGAVVEVKYFNSFVLKKTVNNVVTPDQVIWNGSFGIPQAKGGYPVVVTSSTNGINNWAIEESRIRGGYNNVSTDYGAKAYLVEVPGEVCNCIEKPRKHEGAAWHGH